jgi:hypothetical protein
MKSGATTCQAPTLNSDRRRRAVAAGGIIFRFSLEDDGAHERYGRRKLRTLSVRMRLARTEAAPQVQRETGVLVLDGSTLDKPYARKMGLLTRHWSGKHRRVAQGSNLLTLL